MAISNAFLVMRFLEKCKSRQSKQERYAKAQDVLFTSSLTSKFTGFFPYFAGQHDLS